MKRQWILVIAGLVTLAACEPKGATLTALKVTRDSAGLWSAGCVVDV